MSQPYNPPISREKAEGRWFMISLSVFFHVVLVGLVIAFAHVSFPALDEGFRISVSEVQLNVSDLPPLRQSQEAGPEQGTPGEAPSPRQEAAIPQLQEEETTVEEEIVEEQPEPEPERTEPIEVEKKPEIKPEEKKPETKIEKKPEKKIVTTNPKPAETKADPQPEPEQTGPTPREVAQELESKKAVYKATRSYGNTSVTRYVAAEGDPGGGGGPALYRSVLIGRIGGFWNPPFTRKGEVRDATVEFTIYSPPLDRNAVNQVRTATIQNIRLIKSSGDLEFDSSALEAVRRVRQWPPLPDSYRKDTLVVQCRFYLIGDDQ